MCVLYASYFVNTRNRKNIGRNVCKWLKKNIPSDRNMSAEYSALTINLLLSRTQAPSSSDVKMGG